MVCLPLINMKASDPTSMVTSTTTWFKVTRGWNRHIPVITWQYACTLWMRLSHWLIISRWYLETKRMCKWPTKRNLKVTSTEMHMIANHRSTAPEWCIDTVNPVTHVSGCQLNISRRDVNVDSAIKIGAEELNQFEALWQEGFYSSLVGEKSIMGRSTLI